ncbi:MAG: ComEA family DNA-binding protein [Deferrisomatales bacterium]|nr:ComEA family DNA-binding protein [Deferrisomatales bacterium]
MADRAPDRSAVLGLVLLAALSWLLPQGFRLAARLFGPASPAVYGVEGSSGLLWSPRDSSPVPDGHLLGDRGRAGALVGGWEGLLFGTPLDLNRATREDLEALPGVGPKTAEAILSARESAGGFDAVEDLLRVRGIGPRTLTRLRPLVRVEKEAP